MGNRNEHPLLTEVNNDVSASSLSLAIDKDKHPFCTEEKISKKILVILTWMCRAVRGRPGVELSIHTSPTLTFSRRE